MTGGSDAAHAVKPFDWREIEDEDELSFGSEYESDENVDADAGASAPRSDPEVDVAAQSTALNDQSDSAPSKPAAAKQDADELKTIEPAREDIVRSNNVAAANGPRHENKPHTSTQHARKVPRTPVKWSPPPSKPSHDGRSGQSLGGGVRGKPQGNRGTGMSVPGVQKKVFNSTARGQPQMMPPRPHLGSFGTRAPMMSGFRGRGVQHDAQPIERGQFMTKRTNVPPQRPQGMHHGSAEMASALDQLKGGAVPNVSAQPHMAMNPAAPPFTPRPPAQPPQQNIRPPQQPQPPKHMRPPPHQTRPHFQPPQVPGASPYRPPRPAYARPVAVASTWIRGVSDSVGAEITAATADSKSATKATTQATASISSTWFNPAVVATAAPQFAAAPAATAPAASAPASSTPAASAPVNKQALDAAAAEELRRKDAEIARLKAQLEQQDTHKRKHSGEEIDDDSVPDPAPKKAQRVAEGNIESRIGSHGEGHRKKHISARVGFLARSSDEKAAVKETAASPSRSSTPPTQHRTQEKEQHGRDRRYDAQRRAHKRSDQAGQSGFDRSLKPGGHRRIDRREELTDAEKLRMQRFNTGKAL